MTNLNPLSLSSGTANISIRGNADTATNAASLGGHPASFYATTAANAFTGNQNIGASLNVSRATSTGSLTIGAGTAITQHLSLTVNPAFPALKAGACAAATFTFTGASDGDTTALGLPSTRMTGGGSLNYSAWVSAADKIAIQVCNVSGMPQRTAAAGAIRVDVWKH